MCVIDLCDWCVWMCGPCVCVCVCVCGLCVCGLCVCLCVVCVVGVCVVCECMCGLCVYLWVCVWCVCVWCVVCVCGVCVCVCVHIEDIGIIKFSFISRGNKIITFKSLTAKIAPAAQAHIPATKQTDYLKRTYTYRY